MNLGLREHFVTVFRHWGKILLVILGALMVAGAFAFLTSKVYVSETRVLLLSRSPAARAVSNSITEDGSLASPQEQVQTQVGIIKSPVLAIRLAEKLGPERVLEEMTWKWDWLRELPGQWKDNAILSLYNWDLTRDLIISMKIPIPTPGPAPITVGRAAGKIGDNIHADAILKTDMFGVAFASPDPKFSTEVVNALVELYAEYVVALGSPVRSAKIAQDEASRLEAELRETESQLRAYAVEHQIIALDRQKTLALDRLSRLQDELSNARRERLETDRRIASIQTRLDEFPTEQEVSVTTVANPLLDRLRERLAQLQTELRQFVPGSPSANKLRIEIEGVESQLANAETAVKGSQTVGTSSVFQQLQSTLGNQKAEITAQEVRVDFLTEQITKVDAEVRRLDDLELNYVSLQRNVEAKEAAYRFALQKREETSIAEQLSIGRYLSPVVQVEPAMEPVKPRSPRRLRLLALGLVAGLLAGIGLAYVLEFSRKVMLTRREVEIAVGLPVLATQQFSGFIRRRKRANRTEIRTFVSRLLHKLQPNTRHVLMFISDERLTGQTTVIGAIADVMTQQRARVLKVELVPSTRTQGVTEVSVTDKSGAPARGPGRYVAGDRQDVPLDTAVLKGLEAHMHDALRDLLRERGSFYDVVLIDSPHLGDFPEALFLAQLVDDVLPVVEAGRTKVRGIGDVIEQFRDIDASVPGVIVTKLRHSQTSWAFSWMSMLRLNGALRRSQRQNEVQAV